MNSSSRFEGEATAARGEPAARRNGTIPEIVIVDSDCDRYADFVEVAQRGGVGLHFCVDGRSAVRLARRFRADCWLVASELPDMSGFDLLEMLSPHVLHGSVDPLLGGATISLNRIGQGLRSGVFVMSDSYSIEEEQRALIAGVAGYLVRPVTLDMIRSARTPVVREQRSESTTGA